MLLIVFMSTLGCERGRSEALDYVKSHVSFDCFRVELQAKFCCCENGGYFLKKLHHWVKLRHVDIIYLALKDLKCLNYI